MINTYSYHATRYSSQIEANGFDIQHSYENRNEQLGAGEAMYFSFNRDVAMSYTIADANESFLPIIIDELEEQDEVAGFLLRSVYNFGREKGWEMLFDKYGNNAPRSYDNEDFDLNDVYDLSEYIRGSKVLEEENSNAADMNFMTGGRSASLPGVLIEDAKKMGITTLPSEPKILRYKISDNANIKNVGETESAPTESKLAKEEGYEGIIFKNNFSIDNQSELALFKFDCLEKTLSVDKKIATADINYQILSETLDLMEDIRFLNSENIQEKLLIYDFFSEELNERELRNSLRNILSIMYKLKIIDILDNNEIKILIDVNKNSFVNHLTTIITNDEYANIVLDNVKNDLKEKPKPKLKKQNMPINKK